MAGNSQEIELIRTAITQLSRRSAELELSELAHHLNVAELVAIELEKNGTVIDIKGETLQ